MRTRARPLRGLDADEAQLARYGLPVWRTEADIAQALEIDVRSVAALLGAQCARSLQPLRHLHSAQAQRRRAPDHGAEVAAQGDSAAAASGPGEQAAVQRVRARLPCRALGAQQCAAACRQGRGAAPGHQGLLPLAAFRTRARAADRARLWLPGGDRPGRADDRSAAPARERRRRSAASPRSGRVPARRARRPARG